MNYPVWELDYFGGGFLIALIAVIHVYVAHFAVGGGLFLVMTEMKGVREHSSAILDYTHRHSRFFLLLTMVFGALTGVGIWFTISVLNPAATSALIHIFVWGWATEWLFFMGEIVTLFIYFYKFGKMKSRQHIRVGFIYFIFAWLSLFIINGIVTFMLTPGTWLQTGNFWDGLFNPTFWPSLFFRSSIAFMLAGLFGLLTVSKIPVEQDRKRMFRYCAWWVLIPFIFMIQSAWLYVIRLPESLKIIIFERSPEIPLFITILFCMSPVIFVSGLILAFRAPVNMKKALVIVLLIIGLACMGAFEWIREAGRRPYILYGHMYSTGIFESEMSRISETGILKSAKWVENKTVNDSNKISAGMEVFRLMCSSCHSIGGPVNNIIPLTRNFTFFGMDSFLSGMGKLNDYMHLFIGNEQERKALAAYLIEKLHKKQKADNMTSPADMKVELPHFDKERDKYVLLAWTDKGMYSPSDCDSYFSLAPPGVDINAQLIRRGETPEHVANVIVAYRIEDGFSNPSAHVDFWKYSSSLIGKDIPINTGISGKKTCDRMEFDDIRQNFSAKNVPVIPYRDDGMFHPYPIAVIEASDQNTGAILAATKIPLPASTEIRCNACHGGNPPLLGGNGAGISDETARNILIVHDKMSSTNLLDAAKKGQPKSCQSCHSEGSKTVMNLSASIHGYHAVYLSGKDADACAVCHPTSSEGFTQGFRGVHRHQAGMNCINCHGSMEDHSLSLLESERLSGKPSADRLIKHIATRDVKHISPRIPWINMPDCMNCHVNFNPPETDTAQIDQQTKSEDVLYRLSKDEAGIMCAGCHGSPHAIYPAKNIFDTDSLPPRQYQGNYYNIAAKNNCKVCHLIDMEEEMHHPNSYNAK